MIFFKHCYHWYKVIERNVGGSVGIRSYSIIRKRDILLKIFTLFPLRNN